MKMLSVCFFSSRRRHTRYWRDWSSDVCSPISHDVSVLRRVERLEHSRVCGLVPRPGPPGPAGGEIAFANNVPKREHAVVMLEIVRGHGPRIGDGSMMRVVKQQHIPAAAGTVAPDPLDQRVIVPLV